MAHETYILKANKEYELKSCPECDSWAAIESYGNKVHVLCPNCGLCGVNCKSVEDAIQEWNRIKLNRVDKKEESS